MAPETRERRPDPGAAPNPDHATSEVTPDGSEVAAWVARIRPHLAHAVEGIVAAGRELIDAKAALPHGQFGPLLDELGLSRHMAGRFMRVASNPVLTNRAPVHALPASVSVLDELGKLPDDELEDAIERGDIGPSTTRQQAARLVTRQRNPRPWGRDAGDVNEHDEVAGPPSAGQDFEDDRASAAASEAAEFLEECAREIAALAAATDAGVYGPDVQVRDSQLDTTHLLAALLAGGTDIGPVVASLAGAQWWTRCESWVTFCSWVLTLMEPDIASPWADQLTGEHDDLMSAARVHVGLADEAVTS